MPTAKCIDCHSRLEWRNQRGSKLSSYRCKCNGRYEQMKYQGGRIAFGVTGVAALSHGAGVYVNKNGDEFITAYGWDHFKKLSDVTVSLGTDAKALEV